jgi:hypothetical protein
MLAAWNIGWDAIIVAALIALAIADRRCGVTSPFSHWLGIAAWIWGRTLSILAWLLIALGIT